jgi:hypothetical protein
VIASATSTITPKIRRSKRITHEKRVETALAGSARTRTTAITVRRGGRGPIAAFVTIASHATDPLSARAGEDRFEKAYGRSVRELEAEREPSND